MAPLLNKIYRGFFKQALDIVLAGTALIGFSVLLLILAILIKRRFGSPVFFLQTRPGKNGKPFTLIKFRTMLDSRDKNGNLLDDSERLTQFGQFLRFSSLDELPTLLNVLKGEMSLVGPRPLLMEYIPLYSTEQIRRHEVKPGMTGWAQIHGRNAISWEEKFDLDVWYVDRLSLLLDMGFEAQRNEKLR